MDGQIEAPFVVRGINERDPDTGLQLYWSNEEGWVARRFATRFTLYERQTLNLPSAGSGSC